MTDITVTTTASGGPAAVLGGGFGQVIVAWTALGVITCTRFSSTGAPLGDPFTVNDATAPATGPVLALTSRGYLVAWTSGHDLFLQQMGPDDRKIGARLRVNDVDVDPASPPAVARLLDGGLVVCWADASREAVRGQLFRGDLSRFKGPFLVNVPTGEDYVHHGVVVPHGRSNFGPAVTALDVGDTGYAFVVAWRRGTAVETTAAHFRFFGEDGTPEPSPPDVPLGPDGKPWGFEHMARFDLLCGPGSLAPVPGGGFCALRVDPGPAGDSNVAMADTYGSTGDHQLMVNLTHVDDRSRSSSPAVASSPVDNLVVVWAESDEHASGNPGRTIRGTVTGSGLGATAVVTVSGSPAGAQDLPRVASVVTDAGYVTAVVWSEGPAVKLRVLQGDDLLHDA